MKKVYVRPEVDYINFYSEEELTTDSVTMSVQDAKDYLDDGDNWQ